MWPRWFCHTNVSQFPSVLLQIVSSIRWAPSQGCASLWHSFLSPTVHIHHSVGRHLWWLEGEQSALTVIAGVKSSNTCAAWVPLSVGHDVAQIVKLDVKWRAETLSRGWQELWCLSLSSVVLMRAKSAALHCHGPAGCKLTVIEETYCISWGVLLHS